MNAENVDLSQQVIGAAMKVLNTLRPGLDEKLYERALVIELRNQGLRCEQQKSWNVFYDNQLIGTLVPDLIVEERLIVDPKVVTTFTESHTAQMLGYLNITGLKTALLLNFKESKLGIKRISNSTRILPLQYLTESFTICVHLRYLRLKFEPSVRRNRRPALTEPPVSNHSKPIE